MQYRFTRAYRSDFGTWLAGDVADFDDDTAAWLNRDEPGCLVAVTQPETAPAVRAIEEAPHDRQFKASRNRSGRGGE